MGALTPALPAYLQRRWRHINVFQLVRLLLRQGKGPATQLNPPGKRAQLRFQADLTAAFPGNEISRLELPEASDHPSHNSHTSRTSHTVRLHTANYCLAGTLGGLPEPYTEWLREQQRLRQRGSTDFLDMFTQRLHTLRHHCKRELLPELDSAAPADSALASYVASLMGLGLPELADQLTPPSPATPLLPARAWLALAGLLGNCRRSAADVEAVLHLVYQVPVSLQQWRGAWCPIASPDRNALGRDSRLGQRTVLGRRVWAPQARVRVELRQLDYRRACRLLPPARADQLASDAHRHLRGLLHLLLDRQADCEVALQITLDSRPEKNLLMARPDQRRYWGLRLGQTAWLGLRAPARAASRFLVLANDPAEAA